MLLKEIVFRTEYGDKRVSVHCGDITSDEFSGKIDVLTVSAFKGDYMPLNGTLIGALSKKKISVWLLAKLPMIDLRKISNIWISDKVPKNSCGVKHIGCIEFAKGNKNELSQETVFDRLSSYYNMISIAGYAGVPVKTVSMPLIGTGNQHYDPKLMIMPLLRETFRFLEKTSMTDHIMFCEYNREKAELLAQTLESFYLTYYRKNTGEEQKNERIAFVSYSSADRNIADLLCSKLENAGIKVWYAPRNIGLCKTTGEYAGAIVEAIEKATHFIVILSENSLGSQHVLNEVDLAFARAGSIVFKPLKIDMAQMGPSFKYYLSRQHYMDASIPPLEERIDEFVSQF